MPLLRCGFEAAHKEAEAKAREEKAAWRAISGETYGDKKAASWTAEKPAFDAAALADAQQRLAAADAGLAAANQRMGALQRCLFLIAAPTGKALNQWTLRARFDDARANAAKAASEAGDKELAARVRAFQFRDIRPKATSELPLEHASRLLGHAEQKMYRRVGDAVKPTR